MALAVGALALTRPYLRHIDDPEPEETRDSEAQREAQAVTVGDS